MRTTLLAAVAIGIAALNIPSGAQADGTAEALRQFGWEGIWSADCSIPNEWKPGVKAVLPRSYHRMSAFGGQPTNAVVMYQNGQKIETIWTIISAKIVADNKLLTVSVAENASSVMKSESVTSLVNGRMFIVRSRMTVTDKQGNPISDHLTVLGGMTVDADDNSTGVAPTLEKCRP
jgi:hypothetical protein